jgi:hypothetical protein
MRFFCAFLTLTALTTSVQAQTYNSAGPRVRFGAEGGAARTDRFFDNDGDRQTAGETLLGLTTAKAWFTYDLAQIGDMGVGVGASFDMADQRTSAGGTDVSSGFQPRNAGFHGYIRTPAYSLRGGYLLDIGEQGESAAGDVKLANSDGVDAVFLGATLQGWATPNVRLFGGADYHLTLAQDVERVVQVLPGLPLTTQRGEFDPGDQLDAFGGLGFRVGGVELGAKLHLQLVTEAKLNDTVQNDSDGNSVSVIPYLTFAQPGSPFRFWLEGAGRREYGPLGIALAGKNQPAGQMGLTAGVTYGF